MPAQRRRALHHQRRGFTLIETMTALALTSIAATTMLVGMAASTSTTDDALDRVVAEGLARQLLDEISGMRYCESGASPTDTFLGPGSPEVSAGARRLYDDIDDYHGIRTLPPTDRWGVTLGTDDGRQGIRLAAFQAPSGFFTGWKQQIDIRYVNDTNLATELSSGSSNHRVIHVRIFATLADGTLKELAHVSRIVANVPNG